MIFIIDLNVCNENTSLIIFYRSIVINTLYIKRLIQIFPDYYDLNTFTIPINLIVNKKYMHLFKFQMSNSKYELIDIEEKYSNATLIKNEYADDLDFYTDYVPCLLNKKKYYKYIIKLLITNIAVFPDNYDFCAHIFYINDPDYYNNENDDIY